ncbi:shikimate kinase, partial [Candidatus Omnitrophota bacterium]
MDRNIALVGFMGAGKTAVGKLLANRLNRTFVDVDDVIEQRESRPISDIFSQDGEPYFRKIEKEATKEVALQPKRVIACGGGVVLDKENIANLKGTSTIIYLKTTPEVILKRTKG